MVGLLRFYNFLDHSDTQVGVSELKSSLHRIRINVARRRALRIRCVGNVAKAIAYTRPTQSKQLRGI